ncbi:MAG: hypothetical protein RIS21_370 [Planctomycetota bacterium]
MNNGCGSPHFRQESDAPGTRGAATYDPVRFMLIEARIPGDGDAGFAFFSVS